MSDHPLGWKGPCALCATTFEATGFFAVEFKGGKPALCHGCQERVLVRQEVEGLTRGQVEACLGRPKDKMRTPGKDLWVYYYETLEIYFDRDDVAEWTYTMTKEEGEAREREDRS